MIELGCDLTTIFFSPFLPPFFNGARREPRLASPRVLCRWCSEPLIEANFSKHVAYLCDNWRCPLFRQPQGCRSKESDSYMLRGMGIKPREASNLSSDRRMKVFAAYRSYRVPKEKGG